MKKVLLCLALFLLLASSLNAMASPSAAPDPAAVRFTEVARGFSQPLGLVYPPGDSERLFIVEQGGKIRILQNGAVNATAFLDVGSLISRSGSEQGLLGLAFHPDYAQNGWFFINYTDRAGDTVIARYSVSPSDANQANPASAETVLTVDQPYSNHNGGHLAFGPDGYLYIGLGDGGSGGDPQNRAQNPQNLLGKMLRIDVNQLPYSIPPTNPFATSTSTRPEIWALGLRNPWRYSFDRGTGDLYIADVGQNTYEEVNFQPAASAGGENYGWNIYEGKHNFKSGSIAGAVMPFAEYDHGAGCSVSGGNVYRGAAIPSLTGIYLYGDFCTGTIWSAYQDAAGAWQTPIFLDTNYQISAFGEDAAGELYILNYGGTLVKIEPTAAPTTATPIAPTATPLEPTAVSPTATESPTTLPPTATPPITTPTLSAIFTPAAAAPGESVAVNLALFSVSDVYGLEVTCRVNPAVLTGSMYSDGDGFNSSNSYIVDTNFQPDGTWTIAASLLEPAAPIMGDVIAFSLVYTVTGAGDSEANCTALAVDRNGRELPLAVQKGIFDGIDEPVTTEEPAPTAAPTVEAPTPTAIPPTELPTIVPPTPQPGAISGAVAYQNRPDNAGISLRLLDVNNTVLAEATTTADGAFVFADVPLGVYILEAAAPGHLGLLYTVVVETDGQALDMGIGTLRAGDADDSRLIDLVDAAFVGANFGVSVPPAPGGADLNADGLVNISDLVLVGGNFGLAGPLVVE